MKSVLLGGVSGKIVRTAACPVLIVPHGADGSLDPFFDHGLRETTETNDGVSRTIEGAARVAFST
jgi:hypothetical protein